MLTALSTRYLYGSTPWDGAQAERKCRDPPHDACPLSCRTEVHAPCKTLVYVACCSLCAALSVHRAAPRTDAAAIWVCPPLVRALHELVSFPVRLAAAKGKAAQLLKPAPPQLFVRHVAAHQKEKRHLWRTKRHRAVVVAVHGPEVAVERGAGRLWGRLRCDQQQHGAGEQHCSAISAVHVTLPALSKCFESRSQQADFRAAKILRGPRPRGE